ncbi:nucleoside 2-deoxyribosyltransferase [Paenibacillus periandrae]|uniref:nucleoside 2-deoxyribosyltransferase n=1 Tax=Paenibacillus periandrae TaxID=1761741 RepID=UPI001F09F96E|nr:nucleoside 2-deoxyribosyltransferase [Paenibacillus periandrae]
MRIFLAFPFTKLLTEDNIFDENMKDFLVNTINALTNKGHSVFSAQLREEFGDKLMTPDVATNLDHMEMCKADLVVAFPGWKPISGGVHVELGWASSMKKPIIAFLHDDQEYTPMITGLHKVTNVEYVHFNDKSINELTSMVVDNVVIFTNRAIRVS